MPYANLIKLKILKKNNPVVRRVHVPIRRFAYAIIKDIKNWTFKIFI